MGRAGNGPQDLGEPWEDPAGVEEERWDKDCRKVAGQEERLAVDHAGQEVAQAMGYSEWTLAHWSGRESASGKGGRSRRGSAEQ